MTKKAKLINNLSKELASSKRSYELLRTNKRIAKMIKDLMDAKLYDELDFELERSMEKAKKITCKLERRRAVYKIRKRYKLDRAAENL